MEKVVWRILFGYDWDMRKPGRLAVAVWPLVGILLGGCFPSAQTRVDEEKEPHFLAGKARVSAMDYQGAMEAFEKALDANPNSGAAHFELAYLCEQNQGDPAGAIYHYEHYLKLRPGAENGEIVKTHIVACKQELARTVSLGPVAAGMQNELDKLREQNQRLREEADTWRAYALRLQALTNSMGTPTARPAQAENQQRRDAEIVALPKRNEQRRDGEMAAVPKRREVESVSKPVAQPQTIAAIAASADWGRSSKTTSASARSAFATTGSSSKTHMIKSGETPTIIAKKYGVQVTALLAANPRMDARHLRPGQTLNLPVQ